MPITANVAKTNPAEISPSDGEPEGFAEAFKAHQIQGEERKHEESGFPYQEQVPTHT